MSGSDQSDELPGFGASPLEAGVGGALPSGLDRAFEPESDVQSDAVRALLEGRAPAPGAPGDYAAEGYARTPGETAAPDVGDEPDLDLLIDSYLAAGTASATIEGSAGADSLAGGGAADYLRAFGGDDEVDGGGGDDLILGDSRGAAPAASYDELIAAEGAVGFFRLDEGSGSRAGDAILGNDGTLRKGADFSSDHAYDASGGSASFDGRNDYLEIAHDAAYELDQGYVQFWFKPDDLGGTQGLLSKDSSGYDDGGHLDISVSGNGTITVRLQGEHSSHYVSSGSGAAAEGDWTHVLFGWGDGGMKLYVDGQLVDSDGFDGGIADNHEPIVVGASSRTSGNGSATPVGDFFDGEIDAVSIHGGAIDDVTAAAFFDAADGIVDVPGDDLLFGADGDDIVLGGAGDDSLLGGAGDDLLAGEAGDDLLIGDSLERAGTGGGATVETNVIEVRLGGSSYRPEDGNPSGDPHYVIRADGAIVAEGYVTWAEDRPFDAGDPASWQTVSVNLGGAKPEAISVEFTNDAYGGSQWSDRNLHVDSITVNGTAYQVGWDLYSAGSRSQNTSGAADLVAQQTATVTRTLIDADFSAGAGDFAYRDDAFAGTDEPGYASGSVEEGALQVELGGVDNRDVDGMSGAWTSAFTLDGEATGGTLTFSYRLDQDQEYESDEYAAVLVSIDGELVSPDGSGAVATVGGGGDSGWQTVTIQLDALSAGQHSLAIGGFNNRKTTAGEQTRISIDNVTLNYGVVTAGEVVAGNDTLLGGEGDDTLHGNGGDDSLYGGSGDDSLYGGAGDDALSGGDGGDRLEGGGGDDQLLGGLGDDLLHGDDSLAAGGGAGAPGNDVIEGGAGDDTIYGNEEHDTLYGGAGDDALYGDGELGGGSGGGGFPSDLFPSYAHELSNVVLYLADADGDVRKVKIDSFDSGGGVHDLDELPLAGFLASEYPDHELVAATIKAGSNSDRDVARGEGELVILDQSYGRGDLPLTSKSYDSYSYASTLGGDSYDVADAAARAGSGSGDDSGDDSGTGRPGDDVIEGGEGDDTIFGNEAHDTVYGGSGDDLIYGDTPSRSGGGGSDGAAGDEEDEDGHEDGDEDGDGYYDDEGNWCSYGSSGHHGGWYGDDGGDDEEDGHGGGSAGGGDGLVFSSDFEGADDDFERAPFDGWSSNDGKIEIRYGEGVGGSDAIELNEDPGNHFPDARDVQRTVETEAGKSYTLEFQYAARPGYDATVARFEVLVDGVVVGSFSADGSDDADPQYQSGSITFTGTGGSQQISFVAAGTDIDGGRGAFLDDITLTASAGDDGPDGGGTGGTGGTPGLPGRDLLFGGDGSDTIFGNEDDDTLAGDAGDDVLIGDGAYTGAATVSGTIDAGNFAAFVSGSNSTSGAAAPVIWVDSAFGSGFGVQPAQNANSAVQAETGFNPGSYRSEALSVDFGLGVQTATVELAAFFVDNGGANPEVAQWEAWRDGELVGAGVVQQTGGSTATLEVDLGGQLFDQLVFRGETYGRDYYNQGVGNDSSDFLITRIDWTAPEGSDAAGFGEVVGSAGDDTLTGGLGDDRLFGNQQDDVLDGGAGDDLLSGGSGDDFLDGWYGADTAIGGSGDDTVMWDSADRYVRGGSGHDTLVGYDGDDWIFLDDANFGMGQVANGGFEVVELGDGDNFLIGDAINQGDTSLTVHGGDGTDWISTWGAGDDLIYGGGGTLDQIWGGAGDDMIYGGAGVDYIYGGAGSDTLVGGADYDVYYVGRGDGQTRIEDDAGPSDFFGATRDGNGLVLFWGYNDFATYEGVGSGDDSFAVGEVLTQASQVALSYDDAAGQVLVRILDARDSDNGGATVSFDYGSITALNLWDVAGGGTLGYEPWSGERDITRFEWDADNDRFVFQGLDLGT